MTRNKMYLYGALGLAAWWYYQKQKGNNIFGQPNVLQPVPVTAQLIGPAAAVAAAVNQPGATIST